jgi:hypothetical protein
MEDERAGCESGACHGRNRCSLRIRALAQEFHQLFVGLI